MPIWYFIFQDNQTFKRQNCIEYRGTVIIRNGTLGHWYRFQWSLYTSGWRTTELNPIDRGFLTPFNPNAHTKIKNNLYQIFILRVKVITAKKRNRLQKVVSIRNSYHFGSRLLVRFTSSVSWRRWLQNDCFLFAAIIRPHDAIKTLL